MGNSSEGRLKGGTRENCISTNYVISATPDRSEAEAEARGEASTPSCPELLNFGSVRCY